MSIKLHLIFDPLCGWCYAMKPFLRASQAYFEDRLQWGFHPGLLFPEPTMISSEYREHMLNSDAKIAALTGVPYGEAYVDRLKRDHALNYHSVPPAVAVLSCSQRSANLALLMLEKIQYAHYVEGRNVSDLHVLACFSEELDCSKATFLDGYEKSASLLSEQNRARQELQHSVGNSGSPNLILEINGSLRYLNSSLAYQAPRQLIGLIERQLLHQQT
ncbi:DsbA family protein [Undibacterium rugosum]|uniref:DSBA-like thioredoxin domain-containing protein n=1 Tax=Undibacterium rugosum TaxID=2762291 RepID=A0A923I373_9BURK|nr:hypothetical protein [Undibacterium rugosum]MBC3935652.1 hypothetical protein [Undibacterium rugosum]MBR7778585.1 hypothetical protein [Undibacterium rugosum]